MRRKTSFLILLACLCLAGAPLLSGCGPQPTAAPAPPEGMVHIPGGMFRMGTDQGAFAYEGPVHEVRVSPFSMDRHEVTNGEFARFVAATGFKTEAEKQGWSGIFDGKSGEWQAQEGADWRHPEGPGSSIAGKDAYPVVQVSHDDAAAYARWAGKRLPTEAEWEFATRGGKPGARYNWGDELSPGGKFMANYWQGPFPRADEGTDGYRGIAPVGKFPPNGYGLYDMAGNVWEWVQDRFDPDYYRQSPAENPPGPEIETEEYVIRGGSFLCAENFCQGYRAAARNKTTRDSGAPHQGFRCVKDVRPIH